MRKVTILLLAVLLSLSLSVTGNAKDEKSDASAPAAKADTTPALQQSATYNTIVGYMQKIDETPFEQGKMDETVFFFGIDFVFSLLCLWVSVWLFTREIKLVPRKYFWFFFFLNLCWFCMLIFLKGIWLVLDYLIIRLQPDVIGAVLDKFIPAVFILALIIYVWILARTFGMTLFGSVGTLVASHLIYVIVIFLALSFAIPAGTPQFNAIRNYFGVKPIVYGYLSDIDKVISSNNILDFIRIRPFHL